MPSLHDSMSCKGEGVPHYFSIFLMESPSATPEILWPCRPRIFFERGVPDSRTEGAEMPMPSASDPSTGGGRLWTGGQHRQVAAVFILEIAKAAKAAKAAT